MTENEILDTKFEILNVCHNKFIPNMFYVHGQCVR